MAITEVVLVSTSQQLLAVAGTDTRVVHEGDGLYFGIAGLGDHIYVACHRQTIQDPEVAALEAQRGALLVFDRDLSFQQAMTPPDDTPLRQPHGVAPIDGQLWVACSYDDQVACFDPGTGGWDRWVPDRGVGPPKPTHDDRFHYNAIGPIDGGLRLLAHNYGRSQVLTYDLPQRHLRRVQQLGIGAHDLVDDGDGGVAVCSSLEGTIRRSDGWVRRVGGFPRGLAQANDGWLLGRSEFSGRAQRHHTDGQLLRLDRQWIAYSAIELSGSGQILDLWATTISTEAFERLPRRAGTRETSVDHGEATAYRSPWAAPPVSWAEWHPGEPTQQWMASLEASVPVVVNPGEREISVELVDHRRSPGDVAVSVAGIDVGVVGWSRPGTASATFALPEPAIASAESGIETEVGLRCRGLWQPPGDARWLGSGLASLRFA